MPQIDLGKLNRAILNRLDKLPRQSLSDVASRVHALEEKQLLSLTWGAAIITLVVLVSYLGLLFPEDAAAIAPWSSDGWGHLMKVEFLDQQIAAGHPYPDLFPGWYNGIQLMRYYAPLPYYGLWVVFRITGNIFTAGNWFLFVCALLGALSFLLYRKRLNLIPAVIGGVLFAILPDNLRVAFADGNIPRVVATSLLPLTFYCLLNVLDDKKRRASLICLAVCMMLITLSHAMMAAIFAACLVLFTVLYWLYARLDARIAGTALAGIAGGVLLAGWWLLPSLFGGITEIDQQASSEAMARFPAGMLFNPFARFGDKEAFYLGISFLVVIIFFVRFQRYFNPMIKSLMVIGGLTLLLSSTLVSDIYLMMPLSHLLWPVRFMTFSSFTMLLGSLFLLAWLTRTQLVTPRTRNFAALALALVLVLDTLPSLGLVQGRAAPEDLTAVSSKLRELPGWRQATLDLSRLGSAPSYLVTAAGNREQVFGWAYQGCATVPVIAALNFALEKDYQSYAVDRLERLGVDDVFILKDTTFAANLAVTLKKEGYAPVFESDRFVTYHKDGAPRAYTLAHDIFGVGQGIYNLALLFPQIEAGSSFFIDDYDLEFLSRYKTLVLYGFKWRAKGRAEALVSAYVAQGGSVVVDLTGAPEDVLSKEPYFLGVYGEPITINNPVTLNSGGTEIELLRFSPEYDPWQTMALQGLDIETITFSYAGVKAVVAGQKTVKGGEVNFIGLNLMFHALMTRDPAAIALLEAEFGVPANVIGVKEALPLQNYQAGQDGYRFTLGTSQETDVIVPVAVHEGTAVYLDGRKIPSISIDHMTSFRLPAGSHNVFITVERGFIYVFGVIVTLLGMLGLAWVITRRISTKSSSG